MDGIKYTYFLSGQSPFIRAAVDAVDSELAPVLTNADWQESSGFMQSNKALHLKTRPTMDAGVAQNLIVGLSLFIAGWSGNKLLDEIYDKKLREPLFLTFRKIFQKVKIPPNKQLEYQHIITFSDIDLTVLIRLLLNDEKEISESLDQLIHVHKLASDWIEKNGRGAPIHCYIVDSGVCNVKPKFYNSLIEVQVEQRNLVIKKIWGQ